MMQDTVDYLPGDILRKVDLAAMSTSLETRIPFLDHEIIAYAWSLPFDYKFRNGSGKYILKDIAHSYIPQTLLDRPKKGFDIPLKSYLRNELKEYSSSMIDRSRNTLDDVLDFTEIDAVFICTPNYLNKLLTIQSLQAGNRTASELCTYLDQHGTESVFAWAL